MNDRKPIASLVIRQKGSEVDAPGPSSMWAVLALADLDQAAIAVEKLNRLPAPGPGHR